MHRRILLTDPTMFSGAYIPQDLVGRTEETSELRRCLKPVLQHQPARNVWLHGPPGTGKTCVAMFVLNELEDRHGIRGIYLNCWETPTVYSVLDRAVRDLRILGAERLSTLFKLERLERFLDRRPFVVVLDEIDKPSPKERDSMVYNLCNLPNVTLICICNSRYYYQTLDSRVRSRLNAVLIEFAPYRQEDVEQILRHRAEGGLRADTLDDEAVSWIAKLANGDARVALQTLRHAATTAEAAAGERIETANIKPAYQTAVETKQRYLLAKLGEHHGLIHRIIRDRGEIASGELWAEYLNRCRRTKMAPAAPRTFSLYVKRLLEANLVSHRRAVGVKGNVRVFRIGA